MADGRWRASSAARNPIPIELLGQARVFRDRLERDSGSVRERIDGVLLPLRQTVRSKPASEWLVREAGRRWEVATQDEGRIAFWPPHLLDGAWTLGEDRAVPSQSRMVDWAAGDEEPAITGFRIIATVARRTLTIDTSLTALASVHALARRVQRGGGTIASAMVDTKDAWQWISLCGDANGKNAKDERRPLLVPTVTGHWRGYVAAVDDADLGATLAPVLRTWLHDDGIEDVGFCSDLAELRQLGPWAEEAQPIMDRLVARLVR